MTLCKDISQRISYYSAIDEQDKYSYNSEHYISRRSSQSDKQFTLFRIFVIMWVDLHRLPPAKSYDKDKQKSYRIQVGDGIWCKSSLQFWCRIAKTKRCPSMCVFMQAYRYSQYNTERYDMEDIHGVIGY